MTRKEEDAAEGIAFCLGCFLWPALIALWLLFMKWLWGLVVS